MVSVDCFTIAPTQPARKPESTGTIQPDTDQTWLETITDRGGHAVVPNTEKQDDKTTPEQKEYVVDRIVDHVETPTGTK